MKPEEFFQQWGRQETRTLQTGERLLVQGEDNDALFFVRDGSLDVSLETRAGPLDLGERSVNNWIGEMGLISPGKASATVVARSPVRLTVLDRDVYTRLRDAGEPAAGHLLSWIGCDLARRIRRSSEADYVVEAGGPATLVPQLQALHGVAREDVRVVWVPASAEGHVTDVADDEILRALETAGAFRVEGAEGDAFFRALQADLTQLAP